MSDTDATLIKMSLVIGIIVSQAWGWAGGAWLSKQYGSSTHMELSPLSRGIRYTVLGIVYGIVVAGIAILFRK